MRVSRHIRTMRVLYRAEHHWLGRGPVRSMYVDIACTGWYDRRLDGLDARYAGVRARQFAAAKVAGRGLSVDVIGVQPCTVRDRGSFWNALGRGRFVA